MPGKSGGRHLPPPRHHPTVTLLYQFGPLILTSIFLKAHNFSGVTGRGRTAPGETSRGDILMNSKFFAAESIKLAQSDLLHWANRSS